MKISEFGGGKKGLCLPLFMDKWPPRKKGEKKVKRGEEKGTEEEGKIGKFQVLGMLWWGWGQKFSEGE